MLITVQSFLNHQPWLLAGMASSLLLAATHTTAQHIQSDPGIYPQGPGAFRTGWTSLPIIDGAKTDNSSLVLANGKASLFHYIDSSYDPTKIKRAVIQIHGENRDSWNQWIYANISAARAVQGGQVKRDEIVIMAPQFFNGLDTVAFGGDSSTTIPDPNDSSSAAASAWSPATATAATPHRHHSSFSPNGPPSTVTLSSRFQTQLKSRAEPALPNQGSQNMIWRKAEWGEGQPCMLPPGAQNVGSFDALDAAVAFFTDKSRFPVLQKVVIAGFSLGGQLVQRYATFRKDTGQDDRLIFWVSSPNSFVYFDDTRPYKPGRACSDTYNSYKYGLEGTLPPYVTNPPSPIDVGSVLSRFLNRTVFYLVGSRDRVSGRSDCPSNAQGVDHLEKMYYWTQQVVPFLPGSTGQEGKLPKNGLVRFVHGTSHQDWKVITSDPGVETLFLKQWNPDGSDATAPPSNGVTTSAVPKNITDDDSNTTSNSASSFSLSSAASFSIFTTFFLLLTFISCF